MKSSGSDSGSGSGSGEDGAGGGGLDWSSLSSSLLGWLGGFGFLALLLFLAAFLAAFLFFLVCVLEVGLLAVVEVGGAALVLLAKEMADGDGFFGGGGS